MIFTVNFIYYAKFLVLWFYWTHCSIRWYRWQSCQFSFNFYVSSKSMLILTESSNTLHNALWGLHKLSTTTWLILAKETFHLLANICKIWKKKTKVIGVSTLINAESSHINSPPGANMKYSLDFIVNTLLLSLFRCGLTLNVMNCVKKKCLVLWETILLHSPISFPVILSIEL